MSFLTSLAADDRRRDRVAGSSSGATASALIASIDLKEATAWRWSPAYSGRFVETPSALLHPS